VFANTYTISKWLYVFVTYSKMIKEIYKFQGGFYSKYFLKDFGIFIIETQF